MSGIISSNIVTDGLLLYLDAANPNSHISGSTKWNDLKFKEKSGTLLNGITFNNTKAGTLQFDGVDDGINLPNLNFPSSSARTLSIWLKSTGSNPCSTFAYGDINVPNGSNILHLNIVGGGSIYWVFNDGDFYTSPLINNSSYYNITCTYNGGILNTNNVKVYLNGVQTSLTASGNNIGGYPNTLNTSYTIGYDNGIRYFEGNISNVCFYNRDLTQEEVTQNYNALKNRFK